MKASQTKFKIEKSRILNILESWVENLENQELKVEYLKIKNWKLTILKFKIQKFENQESKYMKLNVKEKSFGRAIKPFTITDDINFIPLPKEQEEKKL